MNPLLDSKELASVARNTSLPNQKSKLRVERNLWVLVSFCLIFAVIFSLLLVWYAFGKVANNTELVYIKLHADGRSDVGDFRPDDEQLYFRSTIDSSFEHYLKARYGQQPETIKRDFGEAGVFMSQPMFSDFISSQPGAFNAIQKAADISGNKNSDRIEITWGFADHYDRIPAVFDKKNGEVIRSNIHFTKTTRSASGLIKPNGVERLIFRGQWRLLPKEQLKKHDLKWLRVNPVGIEIIQADVIVDPAVYVNEEDK